MLTVSPVLALPDKDRWPDRTQCTHTWQDKDNELKIKIKIDDPTEHTHYTLLELQYWMSSTPDTHVYIFRFFKIYYNVKFTYLFSNVFAFIFAQFASCMLTVSPVLAVFVFRIKI